MTREETKKIIMVMSAAYPNYKPQDLSMTVDTWHLMLEDYGYDEIALALKSYIATDTSGFAPSIGQIIDKLSVITCPNEMNAMEAWNLVSRAIRDSSYHAKERFDELPEDVQRAVGSCENLKAWGQDSGYNENVAQSIFIKNYDRVIERKHELKKMPREVQALIMKTVNQIEDKRYEIKDC